MRVVSYESYGEAAEFDPVSTTLTVDPGSRPSDESQPPARGVYARLGDSIVVFFRDLGMLYVAVNSSTYPVDERIKIEWQLVRSSEYDSNSNLMRRGESELSLRYPGLDAVRIRYPSGPPDGPPLWEDPTPFISEEDWDLGLLIVNVHKDPKRRDAIYRRGIRRDH